MAPSPHTEPEPDVMVQINTTPLVDVMLVLIIMLIVTIPLQLHAVTFALPGSQAPQPLPLAPVHITIDASGHMRWNDEPLADLAALERKLSTLSQLDPQPPIHLRPDAQAEYRHIARVMAAAQRLGLTKLGIVRDAPQPTRH